MKTIQIEEVYTGGGCEQLDVRFLEYDLQFNIQVHDDQSIPKDGDKFCFILCKLGSYDCDDYIEISESFDNFNRETIGQWCEGYLAAKGYKKGTIVGKYTIDDLFSSVNDIYSQFDDGKIDREQTIKMFTNCCNQFIKDHSEVK
jgi:hypothetical protein